MKSRQNVFASLVERYPSTTAILVFLTVLILWLSLSLPIVWLAGYARYSSGRIGDTFGILNSLFSALAFAALTYTLIQQNRTIRQQEEDTRIDRFESKFFQLLAAQREIVNEIDLKSTVTKSQKFGGSDKISTRSKPRRRVTRGRDCFRIFYNQHFKGMVSSLAIEKNKFEQLPDDELKGWCTLDELKVIFVKEFFPKYQSDLSHYFRHLFHTVRLLDRATYIEDKGEYIGILRAQLSTYEQVLLFYNSLTKGRKDFLPLIKKYKLLRSLNKELLINGIDDWNNSPYSTRSSKK